MVIEEKDLEQYMTMSYKVLDRCKEVIEEKNKNRSHGFVFADSMSLSGLRIESITEDYGVLVSNDEGFVIKVSKEELLGTRK